MARGKKECPNCGTELGARTQLCNCGYHFPSQKIRKDLLIEKKKDSDKPQEHKTMGKGRKKCPQCEKIVGARTLTCSCGHDFTSIVINKDSEGISEKTTVTSKETMHPIVAKLLEELSHTEYSPPIIATKREYAETILSYGPRRAEFLYNYAKRHKCWSHVDWDYVGEKLGLKTDILPDSEKTILPE